MSSSLPLPFVHIGLPKCASTYLQGVWFNDPLYDRLDIEQLVDIARDLAVAEKAVPHVNVNFEVNEKMIPIVSSEGFSFAFTNDSVKQKHVRDLHAVSAQLLHHAKLSDTILLLVRNPKDMLRALHEQSIKEGGDEPFAVFIQQQKSLAAGLLDLRFIVETYSQYFNNILILSADTLRRDPDTFWKTYSLRLNLPVPEVGIKRIDGTSSQAKNQALGKKKIFFLSLLNRHQNEKIHVFNNLKDYQGIFASEASAMLNFSATHHANLQWLNRRIVEFASDEVLSGLMQRFRYSEKDIEDFHDIKVEQEMGDLIQKNYIDELSGIDTIASELVDEYCEALEKLFLNSF